MSDFLTRLIHRTQGMASLAHPLVVSRFAKPPAQEAAVTPELRADEPQAVPFAAPAAGEQSGRRPSHPKIAAPPRPGSDRDDFSPPLPEFNSDLPDRQTDRPVGGEECGLFEPLEKHRTLLEEWRDAPRTGDVPEPARLPGERASEPPPAVSAAATSAPEVPEPLLMPQVPLSDFRQPVAAAATSVREADNERPAREGGADFPAPAGPSRRPGFYQPGGSQDAPYRQLSRYHLDDISMAEQAEPPPVQVTIGRVEVRAVLEPPPKPRSIPTPTPKLSLEDYLRQGREDKR